MRLPRLLIPGLLLLGLNALLLLDFAGAGLPARVPAPAPDLETTPRLVILGFDGVDHGVLERYLAAGELPALAALARDGTFIPLLSENPPESPVAWASLLTGVGPGGHGIFDFIRRGPEGEALNGMVDVRTPRVLGDRFIVRPPIVQSRLRAPTFLERVNAAGYPVTALRVPLAFPVRELPGAHLLSGLGTPDAAGTVGYSTLYSARLSFVPGRGTFGTGRRPLPGGPGQARYETTLGGPFDPSLGRAENGAKRQREIPLSFEVSAAAGELPGTCRITLQGTSHVVAAGERSPWFAVEFELGTLPAVTVRGRVRFEVRQVEPWLEVLADPVNLGPDAPFPLTTPESWLAELEGRYGILETVGWQEQTFALNDRAQDDRGFLRDVLEDMRRGRGLLAGELDRGDRLVMSVITGPDRAAHAFWRYVDDAHPLHGEIDESLGDPLLTVYREMDAIIGETQAALGPDDLLIVCSDHGFQTWRYEVHLNQWLVDEGYLVLNEDAGDKSLDHVFGGVTDPGIVDWSRTRAYAMGLGQIYLNRRGREHAGIVEPEQAEALMAEIERGLLALSNPLHRGAEVEGEVPVQPVHSVTRLAEAYAGPYAAEAADLQVGFARGHRVSWQTALLGGMRRMGDVVTENLVPWSGDHCSTDRSLVPGVLLSNRTLLGNAAAEFDVRDVAGCVHKWFGLGLEEIDGRPIPLAHPRLGDSP